MRIGVLGGGQLGRMVALAGLPMGDTFIFLDPGDGPPMAPVARQIRADYDDVAALDELAASCDVVTWEFENVSAGPLLRLEADGIPVRPGPRSLAPKQDRVDEKLFFRSLGIPTADFEAVASRSDYDKALKRLGPAIVIKTRRQGYDGKGQAVVERPDQAETAWASLGDQPLIVERKIPFDRELSILAVRGLSGACHFWPLVENVHVSGMLAKSLAPMANDTPQLEAQADDYVRRILESTGHIGVLALELFQVGDQLLANEMAPRVHNSGHWTIEGAVTSQFANHVRAITGRPLGSCEAIGQSAMINLIGSLPDERTLLEVPGVSVHLYGKAPAPRRKLGHVTVVAGSMADRANALRLLDSHQFRG